MHEILQTNNTLKRVKSNKLYIIKEWEEIEIPHVFPYNFVPFT
jgi:hypothetical protein